MKVDCALLCDAVTTRQGLLNILGAGITRINRPSFPATFQGALAMRVSVHPVEAQDEHKIKVVLQEADGQQLFTIEGEFEVAGSELMPGEEVAVPLPLTLSGPIPAPGSYSFEIFIDGHHQTSVPVWAVQVDSEEGEGG